MTAGEGVGPLQPVRMTAIVYFGGGRRWFTLRAACRAIARQRIYAQFRATGDSLDEVDPQRLNADITRRARLYERRFRRRAWLSARPSDQPIRDGGGRP